MKKGLLLVILLTSVSFILQAQSGNEKVSSAVKGPDRDYFSIANAAIDTTESYLYNPALLATNEWLRFKEQVLEQSRSCNDDTEFLKMYNTLGRALPFTHYGLSLVKTSGAGSGQGRKDKSQLRKFNIKTIDNATVLFTVKTFSASAEEIIPYIDTLKSMDFKTLIVDLRDNTGGTIASAMPLASYLVHDTLYGGAFLTQKYFSGHDTLPDVSSYSSFTHFSEASFELIISGIHNHEGLCLVVYPDSRHFRGDLYILTNRNTASTCEPLVYGLKTNGVATVIGQRTYGAMLNGEQFLIGDSFSLFLPTADFYAADGYRIDRKGVFPDVETDPTMALEKALEIAGSKK